jgi:iron complex outermembrane receptor protein
MHTTIALPSVPPRSHRPPLGRWISPRLLAFATLLLALAAPTFGQTTAPDSTEEVVKLPSFSVSSAQGDRYGGTDITSVSRIATNVLDTPLTINVVPKELMDDLGANVTFNATRYLPGISAGRGAGEGGIMDRQNFRGFESFSKTIDSFSSFLIPTGTGFQGNFDPAFIERSELVMGPDTILSPTGSPGGSINIVTKSPKPISEQSMTVMAGSFDAQKVVLDSTGPITSKLSYRVIASGQDTDTYVPGRIVQKNGSVQFAYAFSPTSKLTFKWFGQDWRGYGAITDINDNGMIVGVTSGAIGGKVLSNSALPGFLWNGWNGDARWTTRYDRLNIADLEYTGTIANIVSVRFGVSQLYDHFNQDVGYPNVAPSFTYDQAGHAIGIVDAKGTSSNPASITELANHTYTVNYEEQIQNDYAANFKFSGVSFEPVVGWQYQQGSQPTNKTLQDKNVNGSTPNADLLLGDVYDYGRPPNSDYTSSYSELVSHAWLTEAYTSGKLGFLHDRILFTGGVSRTWANVRDYSDTFVGTSDRSLTGNGNNVAGTTFTSLPTGSPPGIVYNDFRHTGSPVTPTQPTFQNNRMEGILLKPLSNVSVYGSYSTNTGISSNTPVLWQTGKQYEFGVKAGFFHQNLTLAADHFQINESNVSTINPAHNTDATQPANLFSNLANHGYEFSAIGALTKNVSVVASATLMRLRQATGQVFKNDPDQMWNLLLNYHFTDGALNGLSVFAGVNEVGRTTVNPGVSSTGVIGLPAFWLGAYDIINAGATYHWGHRYSVGLNVDNLLNTRYLWNAASTDGILPGAGIGVRGTITVKL